MDVMAKTRKTSQRATGSPGRSPGKVALTLRLDPEKFRKLELLARAENRTPTNYVETAVLRDMAAKEEAAGVIAMFVPDEAGGLRPGVLSRSEDESDERYAERSALMDRLFAIPDAE